MAAAGRQLPGHGDVHRFGDSGQAGAGKAGDLQTHVGLGEGTARCLREVQTARSLAPSPRSGAKALASTRSTSFNRLWSAMSAP
jgi:hypothetical protein